MKSIPSKAVRIFAVLVALIDSSNSCAEITGKAILRLPAEQRTSVVVAGVRERIARLSNFDVKVIQDAANLKVKREEIVERHEPHYRRRFRWARRGNSYKAEDVQSNLASNKQILQWKINYDEVSGEAISWSDQGSPELYAATIGYEEDRAVTQLLFASYLTGKICGKNTAYVDSIFSEHVKPTIEDRLGENGEVVVRLDSRKKHKNQESHIRLWLQPEKGFSLRRFEERVKMIDSGKEFLTRGEVTEEKEIDGIWFPMKVVHFVGHLTTGEASEYVMTVEDVKLGQVTDEDLALAIPEGTEVCDKIHQKAYVQGQEELSTISFAGKDTYTSPKTLLRRAQAESPPSRSWYLWVNVLIVVGLGSLLVLRQRRYVRHA